MFRATSPLKYHHRSIYVLLQNRTSKGTRKRSSNILIFRISKGCLFSPIKHSLFSNTTPPTLCQQVQVYVANRNNIHLLKRNLLNHIITLQEGENSVLWHQQDVISMVTKTTRKYRPTQPKHRVSVRRQTGIFPDTPDAEGRQIRNAWRACASAGGKSPSNRWTLAQPTEEPRLLPRPPLPQLDATRKIVSKHLRADTGDS